MDGRESDNRTRARGLAVLALICMVLTFFAPLRANASGKLVIGAAASLTFPLREIAAAYEKDTGAKVTVSFSSTGILESQIEHGAPFDLFLAADTAHVEALRKEGRVDDSTVSVFVHGRIVIAVNKKSGAKAKTLADLLGPGIRKVAIANPAHAPYGMAAMQALKSAGLWERIRPKLVYGENVRQTLQFVQTGNAEAGIVALSVAGVPEVSYTPVPESMHKPIEQAAAVVKGAKNAAVAKDFLGYIRGPLSRKVFEKYGFSVQ